MSTPISKVKENRRPLQGTLEGNKDRLAQLAEEEAMEKKELARPALSKFHDILQSPYRTEMTWPWLAKTVGTMHLQMTVSEFYFDKNIVIDRFMTVEDQAEAKADIELKRRLFKERNIKYVVATPAKSLAELELELGE